MRIHDDKPSKNCFPINEIINDRQLLTVKRNSRLSMNHFRKNSNKVEKNMQRQSFKLLRKIPYRNTICSEKWVQHYSSTPLSELTFKKTPQLRRKFTEKKHCFNGRQQVFRLLQKSSYSRYKLMQLYSLYNTLIKFSQNNFHKFCQGFQAELNYQRINVKSELLRKHIQQSQDLSFKSFLAIYKKVEDLMFIQNVADYIQILFQSSGMNKLQIDKVKEIFRKRCSESKANELSEEMFLKINQGFTGTIDATKIYNLCEKDNVFCAKLAKLYYNEIKKNQKHKH